MTFVWYARLEGWGEHGRTAYAEGWPSCGYCQPRRPDDRRGGRRRARPAPLDRVPPARRAHRRRLRHPSPGGSPLRPRRGRLRGGARRTCGTTRGGTGPTAAAHPRRPVGAHAHLGVLHGRRPSTWSASSPNGPRPRRMSRSPNVGVRLPAHLRLRAGHAGLLPAARCARCSRPPPASSTAPAGPADLPTLRRLLGAERRPGLGGGGRHVTAGFASVAAAVTDHGERPVAAISVTFRHECSGQRECGRDWPALAPRCVAPPRT